MPFYLGKDSGVRFTSTTRPGTVLYLNADKWSLEIKDDSINITNILPLRYKDIENDLANMPDWKNYGIPMEFISGGMREINLKIHGFHFYDMNVSVADGPRTPIINEKGKIEILYRNLAKVRRPLYTIKEAFVKSTNFDMSADGVLEYDIELSALTYETDYAPHPKA